jgi:hypothetical protein
MISRRNFTTVLGTGLVQGLAFAANASQEQAQHSLQEGVDHSTCPCQERKANPPWKLLSSSKGDLPVPDTSDEQTGTLVGDIDHDGRIDFAITSRHKRNSAIWMQNHTEGWKQHIIDPGPLNIEAGGVFCDVDGDGYLDMIAGGDDTSNEVWWWQNPHPDFDQPWTRRIVKQSGKTQHHDLIVGDFLDEGRPQLVFWNQGANAMFLARIPEDARTRTTPWEIHLVYQGDAPMEGLARADVDGDGKVEVIGGGRWIKHQGSMKFVSHLIDVTQKFSRAAAGKLLKGSRGSQVVFCNGDGCGPLKWYKQKDNDTWVGYDLLGEDLIHGHTLRVGDIDGDGNLDIFCAEMSKWCDWTKTVDYPRPHFWVFYGDGKGKFEKVTIREGGYGTHEAQLISVGGGGRLDILSKPYMYGAPGVEILLNPGRV